MSQSKPQYLLRSASVDSSANSQEVHRTTPVTALDNTAIGKEAVIVLYGPSIDGSLHHLRHLLQTKPDIDLHVCNEWKAKLPDLGDPEYIYYIDFIPRNKYSRADLTRYPESTQILGLGDGAAYSRTMYHCYNHRTKLPDMLMTRHFSGDYMLEICLRMGYSVVHVFGWSCTQSADESTFNRSQDNKPQAFSKKTLVEQENGIRQLTRRYRVKDRVKLYESVPGNHRFNQYFDGCFVI